MITFKLREGIKWETIRFPIFISTEEVETVETPAAVETPIKAKNGHKTEKVRDLYDDEKSFLRTMFIRVNGMIREDYCCGLKQQMSEDVAIFQVTGFFTYLHREVAMGKLRLKNVELYLRFLSKHRNLWATYNSPKYATMRSRVLTQESSTTVVQAEIK